MPIHPTAKVHPLSIVHPDADVGPGAVSIVVVSWLLAKTTNLAAAATVRITRALQQRTLLGQPPVRPDNKHNAVESATSGIDHYGRTERQSLTVEITGDEHDTIMVQTFRNGRIRIAGTVRRKQVNHRAEGWISELVPALHTGTDDGPWEGTGADCLMSLINKLNRTTLRR